jgi:tetratricopeptide (TPR) repeat protein
MISAKSNSLFYVFALACWGLVVAANGQTSSRLSTCFLARGERALLEVAVLGGEPEAIPEVPNISEVVIKSTGRGAQTRMASGRRIEYVFEYVVESYQVGNYTIPPIEVQVNGVTTLTEPLEFRVFDPDDLKWSEIEIEGTTIRYASAFLSMNPQPYEGETTYTEIKIFVPRFLVVEDWGIPDFQRDGLAAWRFQPSEMRSAINLAGQPYISVAYPSTITPTRTGKVAIGPAKVRLMTQQRVMDPYPKTEYRELNLQVEPLVYQARSLPSGAPEGFENAVGSFRLSASTSTTDVKEGEPIAVDLVVSGNGNLDTLRAPKLLDDHGWKIYEATTDQRGDERRQLAGNAVFHQFMRPLELKSMIPPFRLVFYNPKTEAYQTITSEAIPLTMVPSTAPKIASEIAVPALPLPVERMSDILGALNLASLTTSPRLAIPPWSVHVLGGILVLALVFKALWLRYGHRLRKSPVATSRAKDLQKISKIAASNDIEFLKASGGYIETWLGKDTDPQLQAILAERDAICFRAEKPRSPLDSRRRSMILRTLQRAVLTSALALAWWVAVPQSAAATIELAGQAQTAYDAAKYEDAIKLWMSAGDYETLSPSTLYNIGNACYRAGSPGLAALYYRRALVKDTSHQEASQNLRFIERKYGSITIERPDFQYSLSRLPLAAWQALTWAGIWGCAIALLVFPATYRGAKIRLVACAGLVFATLMLAMGALAWRYFPDDARFAALETQAVIIAENSVLHADAARTSPDVIDAPVGSLCEIIHESGRWAYVAFATKTRGWVPLEAIERVKPLQAPSVPNFRKPKSDGKSA